MELKHDEGRWALTPDYNYMDRWILSFTQSLIKYVRLEMAGKRPSFIPTSMSWRRVITYFSLQHTGCTPSYLDSSSLSRT